MRRFIFCLATLAGLAMSPASAAEIAGPARVIDGGTLEIGTVIVRLHGLVAPAPGQACARNGRPYDCAQEAGWALAERVGRFWLRCLERGQDDGGRIRATCFLVNDIDVNAHMVRQGWALARRDEEPEYGTLEEAARRERLGLWAGTFDPPPRSP
jgi:endonuclease YncB( thermonuclease family)